MTDDPIAVLERELVDAARRRATGRPSGRRRLSVGALASAALIAVALAVAGGAVIGAQRAQASGGHDRHRSLKAAADRHSRGVTAAADQGGPLVSEEHHQTTSCDGVRRRSPRHPVDSLRNDYSMGRATVLRSDQAAHAGPDRRVC